MRYFAVGIAVVALCLRAHAEVGHAWDVLYRIDWQINTSLPFTYDDGNPSRWLWREQHSFGVALELPVDNCAAFQLEGDYYGFGYYPKRGYAGWGSYKPKDAMWLADVLLNVKWYTAKRTASVRPFIITGLGWMWGRMTYDNRGVIIEDEGVDRSRLPREKGVGFKAGFGIAYCFDNRTSFFAEAAYEANMPTENLNGDAKFFPVKVGFSFR